MTPEPAISRAAFTPSISPVWIFIKSERLTPALYALSGRSEGKGCDQMGLREPKKA
jgi:hypothetical protein